MSLRSPATALAICVSAAMVIVLGLTQGAAETPSSDAPAKPLKDVSEFQSIQDGPARSQAFFIEAAKVITHPRCMNCHPADRTPTQGEDLHPHVPFMQADLPGMPCSSCHRSENTPMPGTQIGSIPGNAHWSLAPQSMGWQGQTVSYICRQLKDMSTNGNRTLAQIHRHMVEDHLVGWAWHPGEGREPAPGTQEQFGALIKAWIDSGAACPD